MIPVYAVYKIKFLCELVGIAELTPRSAIFKFAFTGKSH